MYAPVRLASVMLMGVILAIPFQETHAQVHPLARPLPPVKNRKPKPQETQPRPESAPAMADVVYLAPLDVPDLPNAPRRYRAPNGFAGHEWGARRGQFNRLPSQPVSVRAAWTVGMARPQEFFCMDSTLVGGCTITTVLDGLNPRREGGGFHVLSEYRIDDQGFRFSATGVLLFPVVYQFCANWDSTRREMPANFEDLNTFCGMRLLFDTETVSQLRKLPRDHVTQYDLVLAELVATYGKPSGYIRRGRVTIETLDESETPQARGDRRFSTWRWCPPMDRGSKTSCEASIVLSIDPDLGKGIVLFATPALWKYAYVREHGHAKGDPLFALMHARPAKKRNRAYQ